MRGRRSRSAGHSARSGRCCAEAARRVGEDDVAAARRGPARRRPGSLAATEPVGEDDGRCGLSSTAPGGRGSCRARRHRREPEGRAPPRCDVVLGRRRGRGEHRGEPIGSGEEGRRASHGRRGAGGIARARERSARSGQRTAGATCSAPPARTGGVGRSGLPVAGQDDDQAGRGISAGSSKNRGPGPVSWGNCSISCSAA